MTSQADKVKGLFDFISNEASQQKFANIYLNTIEKVCADQGIDTSLVTILPQAFISAYREVGADLKALQMRRPLGNGISSGKIAGTFVFRFTKTNVLWMNSRLANEKIGMALPINVAIALGFRMIGSRYDQWPETVIRELKYFIAKRHTNQESLGICFDVMAHSTPK